MNFIAATIVMALLAGLGTISFYREEKMQQPVEIKKRKCCR